MSNIGLFIVSRYHHHHRHYQRFFYLSCAEAGVSSMSVGPVPAGWLAAFVTLVLKTYLSCRSTLRRFHSPRSHFVSSFHVIFGLPLPLLPSTFISHVVLIAPMVCWIWPYQRRLFYRRTFRPSFPNLIRRDRDTDRTLAVSSGFTLQIHLIMAWSFVVISEGQ